MLTPRTTPAARVTPIENGWRLEIPAGAAGSYRLAQLDDYFALPRGRFPFVAPASLSLRCRISESLLPGTWGFGFWNDPFMFSLGLQGAARRLPVLPNAAWFFHASPESQLSLRNQLPGNGFLAQSFSSPKIPALLMAPGLLAAPLLLSKTFARWIRAVLRKIIDEGSARLGLDVTQWHTYSLDWNPTRVEFSIDGAAAFETSVSPKGPLGLVIWIDNQFAAFTPGGKINAGTEQNPVPAWMEIETVNARMPAGKSAAARRSANQA